MNRNLADPVRSLLINGFILFAERGNPKSYYDEVNYFADYVKELPEVKKKWGVFHADARFVPLPTNSINLVLTSPPYINVHNYHQQHRGAMESLGWDLLEVAKSEFGSNRKHRQNRFLTVIQFAIDMYQVFQELKRLVARSGYLIFVVGRSSTIRGVKFNNGRFLTGVAILSGFNPAKRQERKYKNNFGTLIYEDILHFEENRKKARKNKQLSPFQFAKGVLQEALVIAKESTTKERIDEDIQNAIEKNSIQPSPVFYPESSITNKEIATELSRTGGIIDG